MPCTAVAMRTAAEDRRSDGDEDLDTKAPAPAQCLACNTSFHTVLRWTLGKCLETPSQTNRFGTAIGENTEASIT